jgi:hypothetical protein
MKNCVLAVVPLAVILSGCLKENPPVPAVSGQQVVFLEDGDVEVCRAVGDEFSHHQLHAPTWADSVEWSRLVSGGVWEQLGTDTLLLLPVSEGVGSVHCLAHVQGDTIMRHAMFYFCSRFILIPTAFSPSGSGVNDHWFPVVNAGASGSLELLEWQVRSLDGVLLFEASGTDSKWDGDFNGHRVLGNLLYHIRIKFTREDEQVFTGVFISLD